MNRIGYCCFCFALLTLVVASGCGEKKNEVQVSGKVTIDGEPIENGVITFIAADGVTPPGGGAIKDGTYTAMVPPGEKIVTVMGNKLVGQEPEYADMPDSPMRDKYETVTPAEYGAKHVTPLKATIGEAQEGLDFDLSKDYKGK